MLFPGNFDANSIVVRDRLRLSPGLDPARPIWYFVNDLLALARERGVDGSVAVYLVGAKLQIRFPNLQIRNTAYDSAEARSGVIGDFEVGDTIFHVTVFATASLFEKCVESLNNGKSVYVVTPFPLVQGTLTAAEHYGAGRFVVTSIEEFVSLNLDEMGEFAVDRSMLQLKRLLEIYNERVDQVEADKSLLIKMPKELR